MIVGDSNKKKALIVKCPVDNSICVRHIAAGPRSMARAETVTVIRICWTLVTIKVTSITAATQHQTPHISHLLPASSPLRC